jgi:hypothetical protein
MRQLLTPACARIPLKETNTGKSACATKPQGTRLGFDGVHVHLAQINRRVVEKHRKHQFCLGKEVFKYMQIRDLFNVTGLVLELLSLRSRVLKSKYQAEAWQE